MNNVTRSVIFWYFIKRVSIAEGKSWLSQRWQLCTPLITKKNVMKLKEWVSDLYVNLAMINYPYPANFLTPLPENPVKVNTIFLEIDIFINRDIIIHLY